MTVSIPYIALTWFADTMIKELYMLNHGMHNPGHCEDCSTHHRRICKAGYLFFRAASEDYLLEPPTEKSHPLIPGISHYVFSVLQQYDAETFGEDYRFFCILSQAFFRLLESALPVMNERIMYKVVSFFTVLAVTTSCYIPSFIRIDSVQALHKNNALFSKKEWVGHKSSTPE